MDSSSEESSKKTKATVRGRQPAIAREDQEAEFVSNLNRILINGSMVSSTNQVYYDIARKFKIEKQAVYLAVKRYLEREKLIKRRSLNDLVTDLNCKTFPFDYFDTNFKLTPADICCEINITPELFYNSNKTLLQDMEWLDPLREIIWIFTRLPCSWTFNQLQNVYNEILIVGNCKCRDCAQIFTYTKSSQSKLQIIIKCFNETAIHLKHRCIKNALSDKMHYLISLNAVNLRKHLITNISSFEMHRQLDGCDYLRGNKTLAIQLMKECFEIIKYETGISEILEYVKGNRLSLPPIDSSAPKKSSDSNESSQVINTSPSKSLTSTNSSANFSPPLSSSTTLDPFSTGSKLDDSSLDSSSFNASSLIHHSDESLYRLYHPIRPEKILTRALPPSCSNIETKIGILKNGNISSCSSNVVRNTCSFDSIAQILAAAYAYIENYRRVAEESEDEIFRIAILLTKNADRKKISRFRDNILRDLFDKTSNDFVVTEMISKTLTHTPSYQEVLKCSRPTCPQQIQICYVSMSRLILKSNMENLEQAITTKLKQKLVCQTCKSSKYMTAERTFGFHLIIEIPTSVDSNANENSRILSFKLNEIKLCLSIEKHNFRLFGIILFRPPLWHGCKGHYIAAIRNNETYEVYDDLQEKTYFLQNNAEVVIHSLFYIKYSP